VTGTEKWLFATGGMVVSSPAVSNGFVYVGSDDNNLYAIDAITGNEKWRFKTGSFVRSSPTVVKDMVYIGSFNGNLYAIDAISGEKKWSFVIGRNANSIILRNNGFGGASFVMGPSPAVSNGVVYIRSTVYDFPVFLYAIDAVTGTEKWRFTTGSNEDSSPAVSNGIVYIGSRNNNLYAIDAVTGTEKWRFTMGSNGDSSPSISNGVVYVGSLDYNIYAVGGVPTSRVTSPTTAFTQTPAIIRAAETTQTTAPAQPVNTVRPAETNGESTPIWDRNILIYLILLVFVVLLGALVYDTYYKKKK
jgi:outer membrane protein assembly factor BamB